jgi:hypothetical protein
MVPSSSGDSRAAQGSCDSDIAAYEAHLPVPLGWFVCRWCNHDFGNSDHFGCARCTSFSFVCRSVPVSFALVRYIWVTSKPGMGSLIGSPTVSKN